MLEVLQQVEHSQAAGAAGVTSPAVQVVGASRAGVCTHSSLQVKQVLVTVLISLVLIAVVLVNIKK